MSLPRHSAVLCALGLVICLTGHALVGSVPAVGTNQWAAGPALIEARAGATATSLGDGNVLVTGGRGASGPLASAELLTSNGTAVPVAAMSLARAEHTAALLGDSGNILVAGGTTVVATEEGTAEVVTGSVEVFDAAAAAWYPVGSLSHPRAGATAVALPEGRIAIVGGHDANGPVLEVEIYHPAAGAFGPGGATAPRDGAAVTSTRGGHIVVVGGSVAGVAQATADIIDPVGGTVATVVLTSPRTGASATTTVEDQVLIAGGSDGATTLATTEVLNPVTGNSASGATLGAARADHRAYLLPHNGGVLLVGGTNAGGLVGASELVIPWVNAAQALGPVANPRSKTAGAAGPQDGVFVVAGGGTAAGAASASSDYFGFATVKTDKDDYAPGQFVTITGSGWQPGETVSLTLHEVGTGAADTPLNAVVEADGTFVNDFWAPNESHLGVRFYLTAIGAGATAQATFTDGVNEVNLLSPTASAPLTSGGTGSVIINFSYRVNSASPTSAQGRICNSANCAPASTILAFANKVGLSNTPGTLFTDSISVPFSGLAPGNYRIEVEVFNSGGVGQPSDREDGENAALIVSADATPPTVQSVVALSASPTNAAAVSWTVTFSEPVSGVGTGDFSLAPSIGISGASITGIGGSGAVYTVTANTGSGTGTLGLNVSDDDTIVDGASNKLGGVGLGNGNFTGAVYAIDRTLTPTITASNKVYDGGTSASFTTGYTSALTVTEDVFVTGGTANFDTKDVGNGKTVTATGLTLGGPAGAKYVLSSTSATTTANITPKALTGSFTAADKVYDGTTTATAATTSLPGVIAPDVVTLDVSATFDTKSVGTNKTVTANLALSGADAGNYTVNPSATDLADITPKALTGSFTAADKVYDGTTTATAATTSLPGVIAPDVVTLDVSATFDTKNVGTNKTVTANLALSGADAGNYTVNPTATDLADITPKSLTGSFTAANKVYDGTTTATVATTSLPGVIAPDVVTLDVTGGTFDTKDVGTSKTVTANLALSGAGAGNYTVNPTATALAAITPRPATWITNDNSKILGAGDPNPLTTGAAAPVGPGTGFLAADLVTATYTRAPGETVAGNPYHITATLSSGTGALGNYTITNEGADFFIQFLWTGFLQPINDTAHQIGTTQSKFKTGQTIPAKFVLKNAAGMPVTQTSNPTFTRSANRGACDSLATPENPEPLSPDGAPVYKLTGVEYHYNWSTKGLSSGVYRIYANLEDGQTPWVDICLTK